MFAHSLVQRDSDLTFIWSVVDLFDCLAFGPQLQALQFPHHLRVVKHELLTSLLKQKHDFYHLNCPQKTDKDPKQTSPNTDETARFCQKCIDIDANS